MNKITLKVLEWENIVTELSKYSTCETGKTRCLNAEIYSDINTIRLEQKHTTEAKYLLDKAIYPPISGIRNIYEPLQILKIGHSLNNLEIIDIGHDLTISRLLKSFFNKHKEEVPLTYDISIGLFENKELEDSIREVFDDAGNMLDSASPALRSFRTSLKDQSENLKNKLNSLINSPEISKMLQDPVYTLRGDRYVIPVKVEHKAHVPGIVHDMSASGATVFIEPQSIVQLNNKLKEIELQIEAEIRRILAELSAKIAKYTYELALTLDLLTEIDFIFAKAKYSVSIKAIEPEINTDKFISLKNVRHPVLLKVLENVVPNDIEIGKNYQVMVITGPNTGGKTVILKTIGICTLMTKAGLHVPADEASIYPFLKVFADIGDEQSITQSLSTFSGHIKNIVGILENTDENTLILLDEIGAGTDPIEGTVLAEAIMENIRDKGARAMVTTHFSELKALAYTHDGFYNASVEFDTESLSPTYKLIMGLPGKSNAIYIAQKLGLGEDVVEKARNNYLNKQDPTGQVLESLQNTQQELSRHTKEIEENREIIEELKRNYDAELEKIRSEKKKIINIYRKKFDTAFFQAKEEISHILNDVRNKSSFSKLGETISRARNLDYEETEKLKPVMEPVSWDEVNIGDIVFIKNLDKEGIIIILPDKNSNVQVQVGVLKTTVKKEEIFKAKQNPPQKKEHAPQQKGFMFERQNINNTLDLRGERAEEGLKRLELYLDQASLANFSPVYIIHGHGTGKLRQTVREYLKKSPYVAKFRAGEQAEGGDGVTVVELA
ncbi:MAG: hypothetical protein A2Y25_07370 [Candidatus Melainabacteria bacterium GWF2_37_15]|nr:MAG: hypothetical protein A2Y25_07370 [Candidatus Melainabacteria bacterium GWF2_37_15]